MGLFKRGSKGIYWYCFRVNKKRYRGSTRVTNREAAKKIENDKRNDAALGKLDQPVEEEHTFDELVERYMRDHASKKKTADTFYKGYVENLKKHFQGLKLDQITSGKVREYRADRLAEGVKMSTVNRGLAVLRSMFNIAEQEFEWDVKNPFKRVKLENERKNQRTRFITVDEEDAILAECSLTLAEIVRFALGTGMRLGEIVGLTWDSIDPARRVAILEETKNGETRTVPLDAVIDVVRGRPRSIKTNHLFYTEDHTPRNIHNVSRDFHKAALQAHISDVRFHDLRHTFASRCVQSGADISAVQKLLGHKSLAMTIRYSHHSVASLQGAVAEMMKFQEEQKRKAGEQTAMGSERRGQ